MRHLARLTGNPELSRSCLGPAWRVYDRTKIYSFFIPIYGRSTMVDNPLSESALSQMRTQFIVETVKVAMTEQRDKTATTETAIIGIAVRAWHSGHSKNFLGDPDL